MTATPHMVPMERRAVNLKWWAVFVSLCLSMVTLLLTLGGLVWGAATISSSVDHLTGAVREVREVAKELRTDVNKTNDKVVELDKKMVGMEQSLNYLKEQTNK